MQIDTDFIWMVVEKLGVLGAVLAGLVFVLLKLGRWADKRLFETEAGKEGIVTKHLNDQNARYGRLEKTLDRAVQSHIEHETRTTEVLDNQNKVLSEVKDGIHTIKNVVESSVIFERKE